MSYKTKLETQQLEGREWRGWGLGKNMKKLWEVGIDVRDSMKVKFLKMSEKQG